MKRPQYAAQPYKVIKSTADILNPPPCGTFVVTDERQDSIDDCAFVVDMCNGPASVLSVPAEYHNFSGNFLVIATHNPLMGKSSLFSATPFRQS